MLMSVSLLVHYNPDKPSVLACDTSPYGVGTVLSHIEGNWEEKLIENTSKMLNSAEWNYFQVGKNLAIILRIMKFHRYCYGRLFTVYSDHKPLEGLLGENKPISGALQKWVVILSEYDYVFKYRGC